MLLEDLVDETFDCEDDPSYDCSPPKAVGHETEIMSRVAFPPFNPVGLSTEVLAFRLRYRKLYEDWFNAIYRELEDRAERGEKIPGWKLGEGRKSYEWLDPEDARIRMEEAGLDHDDVVREEVISVAVAKLSLRKHLKMRPKEIAGFLKSVVDVKPGKRALVLETDPRQDVQDGVDEVFGGTEDL